MSHPIISKLEYEKLLHEARAQGLFERTYWYYGLSTFLSLAGMAISLYIIIATDNAIIQAFNALFFGFVSVQLGMIGHDLSHGQVFASSSFNRFFSTLLWGFFGGLSEERWFDKHNKHHKNPNHVGYDPDLEIPFVFSEKQRAVKSEFFKAWVLPFQHFLFWPALAFTYPWNIAHSTSFIFAHFSLRSVFELFLMAIHFALLFYFPLAYLPLPVALLFLAITIALISVYLSFAFAPNHKGMEQLHNNEAFSWTHQITLTRNISSSWPLFFVLGGLNFQIEHHLFPTMPRVNYWKASDLVKEFCAREGIPYHETTWLGSLKEMYTALKREAQVSVAP